MSTSHLNVTNTLNHQTETKLATERRLFVKRLKELDRDFARQTKHLASQVKQLKTKISGRH